MSVTSMEITILDGSAGPELPIVQGDGVAKAIVWPGTGAQARSLHHLWLRPGSRTVELTHSSEAVYYVVEGEGSVVDRSRSERHALRDGSMFHVEPDTRYAIEAGAGGIELLGGPAPADPSLYKGLQH